jgi:tRNA(Ile)-lysidine synthase
MGSTPVRAAVSAALSQIGQGLYGVACSGGADSLALAHAAIAVAGAAHVVVIVVDHGLQSGSAAAAERVATWARGQGAAAIVRAVQLPVRASREAAAREARYAALDAIADELGCCTILLGHTARDQAETVLLRVIRGTGPAGLAGMARTRGRFVRPLLDVRRADVEAYCAAHALPVWDDPMNADRTFARIRVRREVMPLLARDNAAIEDALVRLAAAAAEWTEAIDARAITFTWPIDCPSLAREPAAIRKRVVALRLEATGYEAAHLDAIDALITSPRRGTISLDIPNGQVTRTYDALSFAGRGPRPEARGPVPIPPGHTLRIWLPGDRMRLPRLAGHSRKLSDLYADLRVPRPLRATARVLVGPAGDIVWAEHISPA